RRLLVPAGHRFREAAGADVGRGVGRVEIAPALERALRHELGLHQRGLIDDAAMGHALADALLEVEDAVADADIALDHPVERAAVEHLVAPLGRHARPVDEHRLLAALALLGELLLLPLAQVLDAVAADAELDDVEGHAVVAAAFRWRFPSRASATFEAGARPRAAQMTCPTSASLSRSTPVAMPRPLSMYSTSSLATLPEAPAA